MFHIGVATQHPPLPEPGQLSELGINFIKQCLTIDPARRPSAIELMNHPWMLDFRDTLLRYEAAELTAGPTSLGDRYENTSIASEIIQMQAVKQNRTPPIAELPEESPSP
jgi:mitogen-activated protein kinase kinase kinase